MSWFTRRKPHLISGLTHEELNAILNWLDRNSESAFGISSGGRCWYHIHAYAVFVVDPDTIRYSITIPYGDWEAIRAKLSDEQAIDRMLSNT